MRVSLKWDNKCFFKFGQFMFYVPGVTEVDMQFKFTIFI